MSERLERSNLSTYKDTLLTELLPSVSTSVNRGTCETKTQCLRQ